jgi:hypothetical protein
MFRSNRPLASLVFFLAGCGPFHANTALTAAEAQGEVTPTGRRGKVCPRETFHIVRPDQLRQVRRAESLTYVGTQEGLHFFTAWNKIMNPGEIQRVAVRLDECSVANPQTIDSEAAAVGHRDVELTDGGCAVR